MITYLKGDATRSDVNAVIAHLCNNLGLWGAGFSGALGRRWRSVYHDYQAGPWPLGETIFTHVGQHPTIWVASMVAQRGVARGRSRDLVDYVALAECLDTVRQMALAGGLAIHMPRIGCGLAGSSWEKIEPLVAKVGNVYVYDL